MRSLYFFVLLEADAPRSPHRAHSYREARASRASQVRCATQCAQPLAFQISPVLPLGFFDFISPHLPDHLHRHASSAARSALS